MDEGKIQKGVDKDGIDVKTKQIVAYEVTNKTQDNSFSS